MRDPSIPDALSGWQFDLPDTAIARYPPEARDGGRMLVLSRSASSMVDATVLELPAFLREGDLLVANNSAVLPARLRGRRATGGEIEILLLSDRAGPAPALLRPARRVKVGERIIVGAGFVRVLERPDSDGICTVVAEPDAATVLASGELPIPPYLGRAAEASDAERYQTVFAGPPGSVAAPTAGLHLTPQLFSALAAAGVGFATVTLHVGIGTFRPLTDADLSRGELHAEAYSLPAETVEAIRATRARGGRVIAVGTTSARVLETAALQGPIAAGTGTTRLFIRPPWTWKAVDGLLTNFHLPGSSLLMLVGSLTGRERLMAAYEHAVRSSYRFYSYGDAMLVLP